MKLTLIFKDILPASEGQSKSGSWKKQELIFETEAPFPKRLCLLVWNDKINVGELNIGKIYTVDFDAESREYNSRWYTELRIWRITGKEDSNQTNNPINTNPFDKDEEGSNMWPF